MTIGGNWSNAGTFINGGNTVTFNSTSAGKTITTGGSNFDNITFNGIGGGWTLEDGFSATGDLTIANGGLNANGESMTIGGNWSNAGTFASGGNTVTFNSTSAGKTITTGGSNFDNITFNGVGGGWALQDAFDATGNLTITNGTLNANAEAMTIGGNWSNAGTFTNGNNTVTFNSTSAGKTITTGGSNFDNITFNGVGGGCTLQDPFTATGNLTITNGTLNANAEPMTIGGNWSNAGTFTNGNNTVTFNSTSAGKTITTGGSNFDNITFNGVGGGWSLQDPFTATGNLTITNGTLNANAQPMTIAGNWSNSGTFTADGNTVTLDGLLEMISGDTTFYNLSKIVSSLDTLTFYAGSTQTILGALTLQGAVSNLLSLRSSVSGSHWDIDPQGARALGFLDVKDSDNINATPIPAQLLNITDSGNNTGWLFSFPSPISHQENELSVGTVPEVTEQGFYNPPNLTLDGPATMAGKEDGGGTEVYWIPVQGKWTKIQDDSRLHSLQADHVVQQTWGVELLPESIDTNVQ